MPSQSYHDPALVEEVVGALARFSFRKASWSEDSVSQRTEDRAHARLAEGVEIIHLLWALRPRPFPDRTRILVEALNSEDFITVPKINGPVRTIRVCYDQRTNDESVDLYTDSGIVPSNDLLLRLLPPSRTELEENDIAIKLGAQLLRQDKEIRHGKLYDYLFVTKEAPNGMPLSWAGAPLTWTTPWTPSRFKEKIWEAARVDAGLEPKSPLRRPRKKQSAS